MTQGHKILIADDDSDLVEMIAQLLEFHGYETISAGEGVRAIELAHREKPSLILLDLKMPAGSGQSVLQAIRNRADTKHIPVIIISGVDDTHVKEEIIAAGAQDFIQKPYNAEQLLRTLRAFVPTE